MDMMGYHLKWFWQRLTRGWDDRELWSLDVTISKFVLPRLKAFRSCFVAYPSVYETPEAWAADLDKMIAAHEYIAGGRDWGPGRCFMTTEEWQAREKATEEGLALFGKYYGALWD